MLVYLFFIFLIPLFLFYLILCFIFPVFKIGKIIKGKGIKIYIFKDYIHSDYIFESILFKDVFNCKDKFIKIGWGDRKIFLETKSWNDLKLIDFIQAFFGLNETVLRIQFLEKLPENLKEIEINKNQLEILKKHIKNSNNGRTIDKKETYFQDGDYFESELKYNCITNCNNWINYGLRLAKVSNRIWCPLTFWI